MPIWTFDLPDDIQPILALDLSTLSVVTAPGAGRTVTVEADEILEPLLDVTADGAKVSIRQIALVGRERFAGIWPWGSQTSRVRVTVPDATGCPSRCRIDQCRALLGAGADTDLGGIDTPGRLHECAGARRRRLHRHRCPA